jgi:predicted metalloenzyme YecM/RimJ/RimL family protein N-acetyltransferase
MIQDKNVSTGTFTRQSVTRFIVSLLNYLAEQGMTLDDHAIDHVCFRVESISSYEIFKRQISGDQTCEFKGALLSETMINGRPIASFKLHEPIRVANQCIEVLELPSPKPSHHYPQGFDHIEVVIKQSFDEFTKSHPKLIFDTHGLSNLLNPEITLKTSFGVVKFHYRSLADVIDVEQNEAIHNIPQFFLPVMIGPTIYVRPIFPIDFEPLYLAASDPQIWEQHSESNRWEKPVFTKFFEKASIPPNALIVEDRSSGKIIGSTRFYDYDPPSQSVAAGYTFLVRKQWGTGTNRELKELILGHAFKFVQTVKFHTSENNFRSQAALAKLGYIRQPGLINLPGVGKRVEFIAKKQ